MKRLIGTRQGVVVALATGLAVAVAGASFAYFTASGSGTGSAHVGQATNFTVVVSGGTGGTMYPGVGTDNIGFTVTNNGLGHQSLTSVTATIKTAGNGDAEAANGTDITGCTASWFSAVADSGNPSLPADLAPSGTYTGSVDVTMTDAAADQSACILAAPGIIVTAS